MFCLSHRLPWLVTLFLTVALAALAAAPGRTQTVPPAPTPAVKVLLDQGRDALRSGKLDEALRSFEAARETARTAQDRPGEARALRLLAIVHGNRNEPEKRLQYLELALPLLRDAGDQADAAATLSDIGAAHATLDQPQKALARLQEALPLHRQAGNKAGEAWTQGKIGDIHQGAGDAAKALPHYQAALARWQELKNGREEINTRTTLGTVYQHLGRPREAIEQFQAALSLLRESPDRQAEARALFQLAVVYRNTGEPRRALEIYGRLLPLWKELHDLRAEARTLNNIGIVYDVLGQPARALEHFHAALPVAKKAQDRQLEAMILGGIGTAYEGLGQARTALEYYQRALPLFREAGDKRGVAFTLNNIGISHVNLGEQRQGLKYYQQTLPLLREIGDQRMEAGVLTNIGMAYSALGEPERALPYLEQALPLHRKTGERQYEANTLSAMGSAYHAQGRLREARQQFARAAELRQAVGDRTGEINERTFIAMLEEKRGNVAAADVSYRKAIALVESVRASLGGMSEAKMAFLGAYPETYQHYLRFLLRRGRTADAFAVAQTIKARALLDLMYAGRVDLLRTTTPAERQRHAQLRRNADRLNAAMVREGVENEVGAKKRFAALKKELSRAESELRRFEDALYARHPGLTDKGVARTATLADAARLLPPGTALLEYVVLRVGGQEPLDQTVLFVVTREGKARSPRARAYRLPIGRKTLVAEVDALRRSCADPRKPYSTRARSLYRRLAGVADKQLAGVKRLLICPDDVLWDVPFAALHDGKRFLLERCEIAYAYSATGAQAALSAGANPRHRRVRATRTLLALANPDFGNEKRFGDDPAVPGQRPVDSPSRPLDTPSRPVDSPSRPLDSPSRPLDAPSRPLDTPSRPLDAPSRAVLLPRGGRIVPLPGTQREANALRKRFRGAAIYTAGSAQESVVKREAGRYRYVHLASHAFFNDAAPLLSSVVLASPPAGSGEDGFLTAREIFDLDLSAAEMVVLSACNTARGEKRSGEGIVGLTWALFVAGAPTQVLSQWAVDDASTATLMQRFYANLTGQGQTAKGAALRRAALTLLRDSGRHRHPYYWAPFVLIGDWR